MTQVVTQEQQAHGTSVTSPVPVAPTPERPVKAAGEKLPESFHGG